MRLLVYWVHKDKQVKSELYAFTFLLWSYGTKCLDYFIHIQSQKQLFITALL